MIRVLIPLFLLTAAAPSAAAQGKSKKPLPPSVQGCGPEHRVHYLLVRPTEDLAGEFDQNTFVEFARATGAKITLITPDELNMVPKDRYRVTQVAQLVNNLKEIRRRLKTAKNEREMEAMIGQRDRNQEELQRLQPERQQAVRELLPVTAKSIRSGDPGAKLVLVFAGHGKRCDDGKEWCAEVAPNQLIRESEWMTLSAADGAIFDCNFMSDGMDVYAAPEKARLYSVATGRWDLEDAGRGTISTALHELMKGPAADVCAADFNRDGKIWLSEFSAFLAAAYRKSLASEKADLKPLESNDTCIARPTVKACPAKAKLAKTKFDRLFRHPEVLPPMQRAPSSASARSSALDKSR